MLAVLGPALAQQDDEVVRPDIFFGSASAQGISIMADRAGLLPVPDAFHFIALDGSATYQTANQEARASLLYPGNAVIQGPGLACGTFGEQFPPEFAPIVEACLEFRYPVTVFADSLNPRGTSAGALMLGSPGDPVSAKAVRAAAIAELAATTTDAAITDFRLLGFEATGSLLSQLPIPGLPELDPVLLAVDGMTARTDQRINEAGVLVAEAEAVLQGVRLAGGLVEIGSIRSRSVVTDDGEGAKTHDASLEVSGVTVAGVPARITDRGLEITGTELLGPQVRDLVRAVTRTLEDLNITVTALHTETGVEESGIAFSRVQGVVVKFAHDLRGLPILPGPVGDIDLNGTYEGSIVLGATGATGTAAALPPFDPGVVAPSSSSGSIGGGSFTPGSPASPTPAAPAPAPRAGGGGGSQGSTRTIVEIVDLLEADLRWLYLAVTLAAVGLALTPRFSLPARLPRSSS